MIRLMSCSILLVYLIHGVWTYRVPEPTIQVYRKGFTISIPHEDGITSFRVGVTRSSKLTNSDMDIWKGFSRQPHATNIWIYRNCDAQLEKGDILSYRIDVVKDKNHYIKRNGIYIVQNYSTDSKQYSIPNPRIIVYRKGFEISIAHVDGIRYFGVGAKRNSAITINDPATWEGYTIQADETETRWIYKNYLAELKIGDTLHYWMEVVKDDEYYFNGSGAFPVNHIHTLFIPPIAEQRKL